MDGKGKDHLARICEWPRVSVDAGTHPKMMSFQRVYGALIKFLGHAVFDSPDKNPVLQIDAVGTLTILLVFELTISVAVMSYEAGFVKKVNRCLEEITQRESLVDRRLDPCDDRDKALWAPAKWTEIVTPLLVTIRQGFLLNTFIEISEARDTRVTAISTSR